MAGIVAAARDQSKGGADRAAHTLTNWLKSRGFEHFLDPAKAVVEFHRVLAPGGVAFISAPNYANIAGLVKWFAETFGKYEKNSWAPFGNWTPQEQETFCTPGKLGRWFRRAGFSCTRHIGYGKEIDLGIFPWSAARRSRPPPRVRGIPRRARGLSRRSDPTSSCPG